MTWLAGKPLATKKAGGQTTLFYDTFTDTGTVALPDHTPEIGGPWVQDLGSFVVDSGVCKATAGVRSNSYIETGESDIYIEGVASRYTGIRFRVVDANNFMLLWLATTSTTHQLIIYRIVGGLASATTTGASVSWSPPDDLGPKNFSLQAYGDVIKAYMWEPGDTSKICTVTRTDATYISETKHGLRFVADIFANRFCDEILCRTTDGTDL